MQPSRRLATPSLPPPFFFFCISLFLVSFGKMLNSYTAAGNEKSFPAAGRKAHFTRFMRLGNATPVPGCARPTAVPSVSEHSAGTGGSQPFPQGNMEGIRGAGFGHRAAFPHLLPCQLRVPQTQPRQTARPSRRTQERGTAPAPASEAQRERVSAFPYVPLIKSPPPRAGGELLRSISCHGDHKSRKSKNTHL